MKNNKLTISYKVIISCYKSSSDFKKFSAEDLTVKCFQLYPDDFSLKGYKYPDSNRVYTNIMKADSPIIKNGWLIKLGEKMYKISDTGISYVEDILEYKSDKDKSQNLKQTISRDILRKFLLLYKNPITDKIIKKKNLDSVDFDEISYFWSINSNIRYPELVSKLSEIDTWINAIMPTDTNNLRYPRGNNNLNTYYTNVTILQYDDFIRQIYGIRLIDAFPIGIASQPLSWAEEGFHRLSIQFAYQKFETIPNAEYNIGQAATTLLGDDSARRFLPGLVRGVTGSISNFLPF